MKLSVVLSVLMLGIAPLVTAQIPVTGAPIPPGSRAPERKNINDFEAEGGPQCSYQEALFLPWHRAYVLLFEQVLVDNAKRIARGYPSRYRNDYVQAADRLRAPYWDWALDSDVPDITTLSRIRINVPNGDRLRQIEVDNPLYTFRFPRAALDGDYGNFDSSRRERTYRCPSPRSYPDTANQNMEGRPYKEWTYDALTRSNTFAEFSSTGEGGVSLEQIHNGVHWDAGCGGQFLNAEFSAFDPIFMLHHCNMDRLWALWQAMKPEAANFGGRYRGAARFSTPKNTEITPRSPLNPFFRNSNREFHTPESVASIRGFGYSYQGLDWNKSQDELRRDARRLVNRLYSENGSSSKRMVLGGEQTTRYFVTVEVDVTEVERPCSVEVYVDNERAGSLVIMAQPPSGTIHGTFTIDNAIQKKGIYYLESDEAIDKIEATMQVKIIKGTDGSEIPTSSVPSLSVELEDVSMTPPEREDELPTYGEGRRRPAYGNGKIKDNGCR
ncbi:Tyrosinase [Paramyrothecium foliicola]|nr:Tyrosinase [Paramyrothecium foliicola]